jgi:transposase-like protein
MTCHNCKIKCQRFGKDRKGNQRFRCCQCYKTYSERPEKLDGTYLPTEKITQIIRLLVEGCSVRSIERITGTHRDTILNVMVLEHFRFKYLHIHRRRSSLCIRLGRPY